MFSSEERMAYLALALTNGIGAARLTELKRFFGTWTGALEAPVALLGSVPAMNRAAATAVATGNRKVAERAIRELEQVGGFLLTPFDPDYPADLPHITDPPPVLFGAGRRELLSRPAVAIVGTRHPSSYGVEVTRHVATIAAEGRIVVVSGMARGLDAVAHWAALEAGGDTIGVLGNGLGVIYPAANRALYQRVVRDGLLITEFPPGERPHSGSFPRRNRLISAFSHATVVVEAATKSGALITAKAAADQGREVLAVPGQITSRTSGGTNDLIRDGATPLLRPEEVLKPFAAESAAASVLARVTEAGPGLSAHLRDDLKLVLDVLDGVPRTLDQLTAELRLPPGPALGYLAELEIVGLAEREGNGFRRAR